MSDREKSSETGEQHVKAMCQVPSYLWFNHTTSWTVGFTYK